MGTAITQMSDRTSNSKTNPVHSPAATASTTSPGYSIAGQHPFGCFIFKGLLQKNLRVFDWTSRKIIGWLETSLNSIDFRRANTCPAGTKACSPRSPNLKVTTRISFGGFATITASLLPSIKSRHTSWALPRDTNILTFGYCRCNQPHSQMWAID